MANLGAICWSAARGELFSQWNVAMSAEETEKADVWRKEGAATMLESVKMRLAQADTLSIRLATVEAEAAKRAEALVAAVRQDLLAAKAMELADMKARLAAAEAKEEMLTMLKEGHAAMRVNIQNLEAELTKFRTTKSSHALGKIGEAEIFDMLNGYVATHFLYSEVRDMTAVKHVADFHMWVNGPTQKRTKILIDSKKYSSPVQNSEIEKLFSDVDADDEADAGLMVSLDSPIYTKAQFQIVKTKKGKPCLFMTFEKLDDGIRKEVLCWGVRVLVEVVALQNKDAQDVMIEDLQLFLAELDASVSDLENCMKMCRSLHDTMRDAKERLMMRVNTYRVRCGLSAVTGSGPVDNITHVIESSTPRCPALNASREQCKSRRVAKGELCARHASMEAAGKTVARL